MICGLGLPLVKNCMPPSLALLCCQGSGNFYSLARAPEFGGACPLALHQPSA